MSWALHTAALLSVQTKTLAAAIERAEDVPTNSEQQRAMDALVRAEAAKAAALAGALKRYFFSLSEPE